MNPQGPLPAQLQVLERGWLSSNNIAFVGRSGTALVDSGYVTHADQTLALVDNALSGRPLDLLLNTHLHSDHCGGNAALQARYPAMQTLIPPGEAMSVERWDEDALSFRATGQQCPRFTFDGLIESGREVRLGDMAWQVHAAPGHDPHSVILFEPTTRTLISADALWEDGFGVVFPELLGEPSFDEVAATLDLIEKLDPEIVVPGHGSVFSHVKPSLASARSRLDAFSRNPAKHARHAVKVLSKFKILEVNSMSRSAWVNWIKQTPYIRSIQLRFGEGVGLVEFGDQIISELIRAGVAARDGDLIQNL